MHLQNVGEERRERNYLILAIDTARAISRSAFRAGQHIQAPFSTCTFRIMFIILAFAYDNILLLLLLVPANIGRGTKIMSY